MGAIHVAYAVGAVVLLVAFEVLVGVVQVFLLTLGLAYVLLLLPW